MTRVLKIAAIVLLALVVSAAAIAYLVYRRSDQERLTLDDAARQSSEALAYGGSYVRLGSGVTHYELAGAKDARTVVLVHGFSVPYYIWDPTFDALTAAGFRVLRYDLTGEVGRTGRTRATTRTFSTNSLCNCLARFTLVSRLTSWVYQWAGPSR